MNDFVAIDFETANGKRSSVCSVGIVIVRGGVITDRIYSLIRPAPNYYSHFCVAVHGLSGSDTDSERTFKEVWQDIAPKIEGLPLIAHNSPFDEGCLKAVHLEYDMSYPNYQFFCTLSASRKMFGKELPNHQLHTVSLHCGFNLLDHHNALADAEACAYIALSLFR